MGKLGWKLLTSADVSTKVYNAGSSDHPNYKPYDCACMVFAPMTMEGGPGVAIPPPVYD
jgi:hypothetical protein